MMISGHLKSNTSLYPYTKQCGYGFLIQVLKKGGKHFKCSVSPGVAKLCLNRIVFRSLCLTKQTPVLVLVPGRCPRGPVDSVHVSSRLIQLVFVIYI